MHSPITTNRLRKEFQMITRSPVPYIIAKPNMKNILEWHYVLFGPENSVYEGGVYHGVLKFPPEFPMKPPSIIMCTPNGRFQPETRLCLSISDFHPESWNPMWSVSSILTGLLSFMLEDKQTHGSIVTTDYDKKKIAKLTMVYNKKNSPFIAHFPELVDPVSLEAIRAESLKPLPKPTNEPLVLHNDLPHIPIGEEPQPAKKEGAGDAKKKDAGSGSAWPLILILVAIIIAILNASF